MNWFIVVWTLTAFLVTEYLVLAIMTARHVYQAKRPYTEPLNCVIPLVCADRDGHQSRCYQRSALAETSRGALWCAAFYGICWPGYLGFMLATAGLGRLLRAGDSPLPEEARAAIARLHAENEELRRSGE